MQHTSHQAEIESKMSIRNRIAERKKKECQQKKKKIRKLATDRKAANDQTQNKRKKRFFPPCDWISTEISRQ